METTKEIVQNVNQAFRDNNIDVFVKYCTDDITWNMVGNTIITGKQGILDFMKGMPTDCEPVLHEELIIVTEDTAVCTGSMEMPNADGSLFKGAFCDVYQFVDGKIQTLNTYIVEFKKR